MTLSLRGKLLLCQVPLLTALLALAVLALSTIATLGESAQNILSDNYRSVLAAQRMKDAIERMDSGALFLIAGQRELGMEQMKQNQQRFESELHIEEDNITEPGEAEVAKKLRARWELYLHRCNSYVKTEDPAALSAAYFQSLAPAFLAVKETADEVLGLNQDAMVHKSEWARRTAQRLIYSTATAALLAMALGVLASTILTARLLQPLARLGQAARRIGAGDLDARAQVEGSDELSQLSSEFNAMADHLQRFRRSSLGELLQAQQAAQSIIESLPDPVLLFDTGGRLLTVNQAAERMLEVNVRSLTEPLAALPPAIVAAVVRVRSHVLSGRGPYVPRDFGEAVSKTTTEGERYLLPRATPVYGERGGVQGVSVILQDITRLRRFDELKNDLVATVAHEFRTPLTSLRMSIHLCLEEVVGPLTAKQTELLAAAREDCERLQAFIDDLLDLARLQAGRLPMRKVKLPVRELLDAAIAEQQSSAQQKQVTLCINTQLTTEQVPADPERLPLVFGNLIANAIRHTPEGGTVTVAARLVEHRLRFEIKDSGPGIPTEYQREVFQKFFRIPGGVSGAAGLGLSIAKEIVEAHGGEIGVESEPGSGATFYFLLPLLDAVAV